MNVISLVKEVDLVGLKEALHKDPKAINNVDENGCEASFLACRTGSLELVRFVVEYSMASFNTFDPSGRTCLHYGVESGNLEVVKYLTGKVGLSPVTGDYNRITPYHMAKEMNYRDILDYFEDVVGSKIEDMYQNPVRTGMFPDPSIIRVGDDYYMVNSTFVFFPCIPVSHSKDLINWTIIGHAITNPDWAYLDELEGGRGYWAPDISYHNGRFYIAVTYRMNDTGEAYRKQLVVSSDKPEGPYCEPTFIDEDGIDPSIFTDDDGKRYMLLNRGARIFEISEDGTKKLSEPRLLYYGDNKRAPEGPHLLKKDGWYYLFLAEGGTGRGHQISVVRSRSLFGNYEACPYNPIMTQKNMDSVLQCCGHGKPVMTSTGEWYMVYLCYRYIDGKYGMLGRETALDPITWTSDGWPLINNGNGPSLLQKKPFTSTEGIKDTTTQMDDFDGASLGHEWFTPRRFEKDGVRLENSKLIIKGSKEDLSKFNARNMVLRRQKHFSFEAVAKLDIPQLSGDQNLGLTCYYDENTYLKYGIFLNKDGEYQLNIVERIDEEEKSTELVTIKQSVSIYLKIITKNLDRTFYYGYDNENWVELTTLSPVYYICSEGIQKGKRFTGSTVGMYVYSGEASSELYGEFDYFIYNSID